MIIKQTSDIDLIKQVLGNSDICERLTSDNSKWNVDDIPISDDYTYIVGLDGDKLIGLNVFCDKGDHLIIHFNVLSEFRFKYAVEFARLCLQAKGDKPLYAITPNCYRSVINFCLKMGFNVIGEHDVPFIKKGVEYKQTITRFNDEFL